MSGDVRRRPRGEDAGANPWHVMWSSWGGENRVVRLGEVCCLEGRLRGVDADLAGGGQKKKKRGTARELERK